MEEQPGKGSVMAAERLSGLDTSFLCVEGPTSPMNLGAVAIFAPTIPTHPARLVQLLQDRARQIPQLRRRTEASWLPSPIRWVEDDGFDVHQHVHAHRLTRLPYGDAQLATRVSTIMAEQLDLTRPPWELHVITGLDGGRFAVLIKLHHALADGASTVAIGLSLMDGHQMPEPADPPVVESQSAASPFIRSAQLLAAAVNGAPEVARRVRHTLDVAASVIRNVRPLLPESPLLTAPSAHRRMITLRVDCADLKRVRAKYGGTNNDVLLAALTGALREWLDQRGSKPDRLSLRAFVPVSRRRAGDHAGGNRVSGYLCGLPVDEADPIERLHMIRSTMDENKKAGARRGAGALPMLAEYIPAALHRLVTPLIGQGAPLLFDTVVTNVPLPGIPLRCDGAELRELYPVLPLAPGQALGVAFSTYRGTVHIGLHADDRALPDIDRLGVAFPQALAELCGAPHPTRIARPHRAVKGESPITPRDPKAGTKLATRKG